MRIMVFSYYDTLDISASSMLIMAYILESYEAHQWPIQLSYTIVQWGYIIGFAFKQ